MRALLLLASAGVCSSWCCRACKKCLCESYGKCPAAGLSSPTQPPPRPPLRKWTAADVSAFTRELGLDGPRQPCPSTCSVLPIFARAAAAFAARGVDGTALARLLTEHTERLHGVTNTSSLPEGVPQPGQPLHLQFMTRLRDAVRLSLQLEPPNRTDWLRR